MKFTVGIPAYKAKFLAECIDSILAQTFTDFELVIVNDASPENIEAVVNAYSNEKIRYYKNAQNTGAVNVVDNWNICLSYARGEYFILMGDDDKMLPTYLEEFSTLMEKYPVCDIYHCRSIIIDEQSNPVALTEPRPEFESVYDSIMERMKGNRLFFISDYVFKRDTLIENGGFYKLPLAWASDDISSFEAARSNGIAHTNTPVFMYRRNSQTISTGGNIYLKMDAILEEEQWLNKFILATPEKSTERIILENIKKEIKIFIQKKKIRTIYSGDTTIKAFVGWFNLRKKYDLSLEEIVYAAVMSIKEKRKLRYE